MARQCLQDAFCPSCKRAGLCPASFSHNGRCRPTRCYCAEAAVQAAINLGPGGTMNRHETLRAMAGLTAR